MKQEEEASLNGPTTEFAEVEGSEDLQQALAQAQEKAKANLEGWQRTQADFINYKRRSEQEKTELGKYFIKELILKLLPALDDLERALDHIPPRQAKLGWVEGIRLIERKLKATLQAEGVSPIEALGEPFDEHFHEAMIHTKGPDNIVVEEIQKGYTLHDKVIRYSRVAVGNGEEGEA